MSTIFNQKTATVMVAVALSLSVLMGGVVSANAQTTTTAEMQAQIQSLLATVQALQAQLAAMSGGNSSGTCYVFTRNLTVGSQGEDVRQLQIRLNQSADTRLALSGAGAPGFETSYFGPLTRVAVVRYQNKFASSILIPVGLTQGTGNVGPSTRTYLNATCPTTPTTPPGGTTPPSNGGITTPGIEGILTVSLAPTPSSGQTVREGENEADIVGLKVEAIHSDLRVERIRVNLGTNSTLYRKILDRLYVKAGDTTLATLDMDSATVVKEGNTYFATFTGINYVVPHDTTRTLTISADIRNSIDSGDQGSKSITIPSDGIRAIDGAGINQYGPGSSITRSFNVESALSESADLRISLSSDTPDTSTVVASQGTDDNEYNELPVLAFDLRADRDDILVTDLTAFIQKTGSGAATATTAFLYRGSTLLGSASVEDTGFATFDDLDVTVDANDSETLTLKVDIDNANGVSATFRASASSTGIVAENSEGDAITPTGSVTGNAISVQNAGPEFTILSKPTITKSQTPNQNNSSTSTAEATFTVRVRAVGGDLMFGAPGSTSPMVDPSTTFFKIYQNGVALSGSSLLVASSTAFDVPSGGGVVTSGLNNSFTVQEGNTVDIPITFRFEGRTTAGTFIAGGSYAVQLSGIRYIGPAGLTVADFMDGLVEWRSPSISMP